MPEVDETVDTQLLDVDDPSVQDTPDDAAGDEDFLVVDERTKYHTREEAQKAYREAGQRIASLSGWEKEIANRYGIRDPKQVAALLDELSDRRIKEQQAAQDKPTGGGASTTTSVDASQLQPDEKKALEWLKKVAPHLGFVPKGDIMPTVEALKKEVEALRASREQNEEQIFDTRVEQGQAELTDLLKTAKLPVDADFRLLAENHIRAWIEADDNGERFEKFSRGGQNLRDVVREGFESFKKTVGLLQSKQTIGNAQQKNNVVSRNPKPLPRPGTAAARQEAPAKKKAAGITPEVHDAAWELFQRTVTGGKAEQ